MTPDERNLITGLFDRMRSQGAIEKEYEAEALINTQVRQIPDSAYMLVQSVLVQEQALTATSQRVQQLEARVRDLEAAGSRGAPANSGGSFLGGLFGGNRAAATSVPTSRPSAPAGGPWGQPAQPQYQQAPAQQGMPMQAAPAGRAGGGFMAQAMTTAAGVAGGMLAANAISNMLGGHHGHQGASGVDQSAADAAQDNVQDQEYAQAPAAQSYAADDNDPGGASPASDDGGSWGGGGSDGVDA